MHDVAAPPISSPWIIWTSCKAPDRSGRWPAGPAGTWTRASSRCPSWSLHHFPLEDGEKERGHLTRTAPLQFLLMVGTGARKSRGDFSSVPDEGAWGSPARGRNDDFGVPCCVPGRAARLFCSSIVCRDLDWPKTTTGGKKGPSSSSRRDEIGASRALPSKCLSCSCRISHVLTGTVEGGRLQALAHRTTVFYRSP
jgi:hypothetical protein